MPIEGFDYKAFANDLAQQAVQLLSQPNNAVPATLTNPERKLIVETLRKFCLMAGEALYNEPQSKLDKDQASLITQFIGEWTFHKSIDLITGNIPPEFREPILQILAANIFNTAKLAFEKQLPQDKLVVLIEDKVKQVYAAEIDKLQKKGVLSAEQASNAANKSNLDEMVQKAEAPHNAAQAPPQAAEVAAHESETKVLKYVALAIVLKNLPEEKANEILSSFDEANAKRIISYMRMSNIEDKIDKTVMLKSLMEIKKLIPIPETINVRKIVNKFHKLVQAASPEVLSNISINERENVRDFVLDMNFPVTEAFSPHVLKSVAKTLEDKIKNDH